MPRHIRVDGPIRLTNPVLTLVDFASNHERDVVEDAINKADWSKVVSVPRLRAALEDYSGWPGVALLRQILDRQTFRMTQSQLERRFIPIALRAGLDRPKTQHWLNGYRVDFYFADLGLVVETDGGQAHRTAAQQTVDRLRDQTHTAAGLTPFASRTRRSDTSRSTCRRSWRPSPSGCGWPGLAMEASGRAGRAAVARRLPQR